MDELERLALDIEKMRQKLYEFAMEKKADFLDEDVRNLSQQLDVLIVDYERKKKSMG